MTNGEIGNAERGGNTPRGDEKSAEVIDRQRVVRRPFRKRVRNPLKRKDLNVKKAEMKMTRREMVGDGDRQTQDRIAENSLSVNVCFGYHSNRAGKWLKGCGVNLLR